MEPAGVDLLVLWLLVVVVGLFAVYGWSKKL
jgi:hypothetical protein